MEAGRDRSGAMMMMLMMMMTIKRGMAFNHHQQ